MLSSSARARAKAGFTTPGPGLRPRVPAPQLFAAGARDPPARYQATPLYVLRFARRLINQVAGPAAQARPRAPGAGRAPGRLPEPAAEGPPGPPPAPAAPLPARGNAPECARRPHCEHRGAPCKTLERECTAAVRGRYPAREGCDGRSAPVIRPPQTPGC